MRAAILLLCLPYGMACGGPSAPSSGARSPDPVVKVPSSKDGGWLVASVPRGTFGPRMARSGEHRIAVWAVPEGSEAGWYAVSLPEDRPPGAPTRLTEVAPELRLMELRPWRSSGFVVLAARSTHSERDSQSIEAYELGPSGEFVAGPLVVGETPSQVLWVDALSTSQGCLVIWAERAGALADVYATPLGPDGRQRAPRRIARQVSAWQLAPFGRSAALASLERQAGAPAVVVRYIADDGSEAAPAVILPRQVAPGPEIDLKVTAQRSLIAWTEPGPSGSQLMLAELGRDGSLEQEPWSATVPRGNQTLVELVGGADASELFLVWEEEAQRPLFGNRVQLAPVGPRGRAIDGPALELEVHGYDGTLPLFAAHEKGVFAVTRAPICRRDEATCRVPDGVVAVELDGDLAPLGARPLHVASAKPAQFSWDLSCDAACWALWAMSDTLSHVYLERLERDPRWRVPASRVTQRTRLGSLSSLGEVMDLAGLVGWSTTDGPRLAWLSYFDPTTPWEIPKKPAPDGRRAPVRAVLRTQVLEQDPSAPEKVVLREETLSWRAHSLGGLASAPGLGQETLLVWSALDQGEPQVFATIVDAQGKRLRQRMLTRAPGEVLDVAAVRLDTGWLLAWIDGRGSAFEVYTLRIDERLESVGREELLTTDARSPTDVRMLRRGEAVLIAWSDVDDELGPAQGDIYLAAMSSSENRLVMPPRRVARTPLHSHSPRLVALDDAALLGWIESSPDLEEAQPGAFVALPLDGVGRSSGPLARLDLSGRPAGFTMSCEETCRVVLTLDAGRRSELWAFDWQPGREGYSAPSFLAALRARYADTTAPLLLGESVFYVDAGVSQRPELHRLEVLWQ